MGVSVGTSNEDEKTNGAMYLLRNLHALQSNDFAELANN
jgi:hypothetical protein